MNSTAHGSDLDMASRLRRLRHSMRSSTLDTHCIPIPAAPGYPIPAMAAVVAVVGCCTAVSRIYSKFQVKNVVFTISQSVGTKPYSSFQLYILFWFPLLVRVIGPTQISWLTINSTSNPEQVNQPSQTLQRRHYCSSLFSSVWAHPLTKRQLIIAFGQDNRLVSCIDLGASRTGTSGQADTVQEVGLDQTHPQKAQHPAPQTKPWPGTRRGIEREASGVTSGGETLKQSWNSGGPTGPEWQEQPRTECDGGGRWWPRIHWEPGAYK